MLAALGIQKLAWLGFGWLLDRFKGTLNQVLLSFHTPCSNNLFRFPRTRVQEFQQLLTHKTSVPFLSTVSSNLSLLQEFEPLLTQTSQTFPRPACLPRCAASGGSGAREGPAPRRQSLSLPIGAAGSEASSRSMACFFSREPFSRVLGRGLTFQVSFQRKREHQSIELDCVWGNAGYLPFQCG